MAMEVKKIKFLYICIYLEMIRVVILFFKDISNMLLLLD